VPEIAVAVLDVDEREPRVVGHPRGLDESIDEPIQVFVGHQRHARGKARVEHRVRVRRARLGSLVDVGLRVASRVRQLETDEQVAVRIAAVSVAVRGDERLAKPCDRLVRLRRERHLARIRAAVMLDGDRFAAPDQFRTADPEMLPASPRQIARRAIGGPVPAFHRQDAEAVADPNAVGLERAGERRCLGRVEGVVELEPETERAQTIAEGGRRFQGGDAGEIGLGAQGATGPLGTQGAVLWVLRGSRCWC